MYTVLRRIYYGDDVLFDVQRDTLLLRLTAAQIRTMGEAQFDNITIARNGAVRTRSGCAKIPVIHRAGYSLIRVSDNQRNGRYYGGNTNKFGITYKDKNYIVKFPKDEDLSVWTEYIASSFIRAMSIPCQVTKLGMYKGEFVVLVEDFTTPACVLHAYKETQQSSEESDIQTKDYTYRDVLYLIDKHLKMTAQEKQRAKIQFWNMFICDAILGNRDRHWGNWGYFAQEMGYTIAPIFDNGGSLFPGVAKVLGIYKDANARAAFLRERIFTFPASLFKMEQFEACSKRTNYYEMLGCTEFDPIFESCVQQMRKKFTLQQVYHAIKGVVKDLPISSTLKRFYIEIVVLRYACIIQRAQFDEVYPKVEELIWKRK